MEKLKEAIKILTHHQEWRLGKVDGMPYSPKQLTDAVVLLLKNVEKLEKAESIIWILNRYMSIKASNMSTEGVDVLRSALKQSKEYVKQNPK